MTSPAPVRLFKSKRHDTLSSPALTLTPPTGTTWNLQEAGVTAKLIARLAGQPTPKINGSCVVTGPWTVRYDPTATDVNTIGLYDVEIEVTRANGKKLTFPTDDPGEPEALQWRIGTDLNDS